MGKHINTTKQAATDATRQAIDKKAAYSATVLAQDKKAVNKAYRKEPGHKHYNTSAQQHLKVGKDADGVSTALPRPDLKYININYDYVLSENYLDNFLRFNSDGKIVKDSRTRGRCYIMSIAAKPGAMQTGGKGPGAQRGFEFFNEFINFFYKLNNIIINH